MKRGKTGYPIGATWVAVDRLGGKCTIWLSRRLDAMEIWHWAFWNKDGSSSVGESDWHPSYRGCYQDCYWRLALDDKHKSPRFKRVRKECEK